MDIFLPGNELYEGAVSYPVPQGVWISDSLYPLLPAEYKVIASFSLEDRGYPLPPQIRKYIFNEWFNDPKAISGGSFFVYFMSKKYQFPKISIIP